MLDTALGSVPSPYCSVDSDLTIKVSHTGITFLGAYDTERKKYVATGRYRKRYTGSKQIAVDINGTMYPSKLLEQKQEIQRPERYKAKKKQPGDTPNCLNLFVENDMQISDNIEQPAKKERKNCYSVNKKEVRQRLLGYINTQRGKRELYFWTVSFPAKTPDDVCYQAFNIWLTSLRKYKLLKEYLWVAERQDGKRAPGKEPTNTIHFHIAIPHKMPVQRANAMMRGTLKNLAKKGLIPYQQHSPQITKYNGVDIAKHRTTKRVTNFAIQKGARALSTYLSKYVTKNMAGIVGDDGVIEVPGFTHLAWHNSRGFSALFTGITFTIDEFNTHKFGFFLNRVRVFKMNFAMFIPWLEGPPPAFLNHLYKLNSYIQICLNGKE